jgi:hypothetical protein
MSVGLAGIEPATSSLSEPQVRTSANRHERLRRSQRLSGRGEQARISAAARRTREEREFRTARQRVMCARSARDRAWRRHAISADLARAANAVRGPTEADPRVTQTRSLSRLARQERSSY